MDNEQGKAKESFENVRQGDWYVHGHEASPEELAAQSRGQDALTPEEQAKAKTRQDLVVNKGFVGLPPI